MARAVLLTLHFFCILLVSSAQSDLDLDVDPTLEYGGSAAYYSGSGDQVNDNEYGDYDDYDDYHYQIGYIPEDVNLCDEGYPIGDDIVHCILYYKVTWGGD